MAANAFVVDLQTNGNGAPLMATDAYVVKLQTHRNEPLFGALVEGSVVLSPLGQIVADEWVNAAQSHRDIVLDRWIVMPSYIRGIVRLPAQGSNSDLTNHSLQATTASSKPRLLSSFVAGFKAAAAKRVNLYRNQPALPVWQRGYSETLVLDEVVLDSIRAWLRKPSDQPK